MYRLTIAVLAFQLFPQQQQQAPAPAKPEDPLGRETPYGTVVGFLRAADRKDYARAGEYLEGRMSAAHRQELAAQLKAVLDSGLSGKLELLSHRPEGDEGDSENPNRENIGYVQTESGKLEIILSRVTRQGAEPIWLFSSETLHSIPRAYEELLPNELEQTLPPSLTRIHFLGVPLWRWIAWFLGVMLAILMGTVVTRALMALLRPVFRRFFGDESDQDFRSLRGPVRLLLISIVLRIAGAAPTSLLQRHFWSRLAGTVAVIAAAWLLVRLAGIVSASTADKLAARGSSDKIAVVGLARRLFIILVVLIAGIVLLHNAGVEVTAMVAGLGVGGVALALAAQKTLENIFGGIGLIMREAIRVGDFCRIADETGTVEDIALGSTRLRTQARTVVSVPNSRISQLNLENISMRDKFWFHPEFGLRFDTTPDAMRQVLRETEEMLRENPKVEKETLRVRLTEFASSWLTIEISAYVTVKGFEEFLRVQQELLLRIMDIVAAAGTSLALPSQLQIFEQNKSASVPART